MRRLIALAAVIPSAAQAGPPFITDDPIPTDFRRWEIYCYGEGAVFRHSWEGEAGLDLNYGGFRDVQLTATLPFGSRQDGVSRVALGDIEAGFKYRFLIQERAGVTVAFFPKLSLPTGGARGTGRVGAQLPVWAQRDMGKWSLFGGGGYAINPGAGRRDFWFAGATLTRQVTPKLSIGGEVFHQGSDADDSRATTSAGLGATWSVAKRWSLLGAADAGLGKSAPVTGHRVYLSLLFHT